MLREERAVWAADSAAGQKIAVFDVKVLSNDSNIQEGELWGRRELRLFERCDIDGRCESDWVEGSMPLRLHRRGTRWITLPDCSTLLLNYHRIMIAAAVASSTTFAASLTLRKQKRKKNLTSPREDQSVPYVLSLGGGVCCIPAFLQQRLSGARIHTVELCPEVALAAQSCFGISFDSISECRSDFCSCMFQNDRTSRVHHNLIIGDGLHFIQTHSQTLWDVIFVDISATDGDNESVTTPPLAFLTPDALRHLRALVEPRNGAVVWNVISPTSSSFSRLLSALADVFASADVLYSTEDDQGDEARRNRVVICRTIPHSAPCDLQVMHSCLGVENRAVVSEAYRFRNQSIN